MFDALNEASARGIDSTALQTVQRDALLFSATYKARRRVRQLHGAN
jgi:hypothetical protein